MLPQHRGIGIPIRCGIAAACLCCILAAFACNPARAAESDFLERFRGDWSGSGKVQRDGGSQPRHVTCSIMGRPTDNRISAQGSCRAYLIFVRPVAIDVTYDPRSGTYRGTYTGARIGPARLSGTRSGDALNFRIEWPRPVNGDTQAAMVIQNDGRGILRITILDNLTPGGPILQTSEIILVRQ
ncbi:hypothetical protein BIWAKO_00196 [Bosea sp. BIWAKO-01]|nr:hypothetical protein BIWAKO_00196 [Bosea sp. BIWAKO-01]